MNNGFRGRRWRSIEFLTLTLFEREILSNYVQYRKGPNKLSFKGLFQSFSDI